VVAHHHPHLAIVVDPHLTTRNNSMQMFVGPLVLKCAIRSKAHMSVSRINTWSLLVIMCNQIIKLGAEKYTVYILRRTGLLTYCYYVFHSLAKLYYQAMLNYKLYNIEFKEIICVLNFLIVP
jgi:hypothetical protein